MNLIESIKKLICREPELSELQQRDIAVRQVYERLDTKFEATELDYIRAINSIYGCKDPNDTGRYFGRIIGRPPYYLTESEVLSKIKKRNSDIQSVEFLGNKVKESVIIYYDTYIEAEIQVVVTLLDGTRARANYHTEFGTISDWRTINDIGTLHRLTTKNRKRSASSL